MNLGAYFFLYNPRKHVPISNGKVEREIKYSTHPGLEFLGGFAKAKFTQGDPLDRQWVREDYFLEGNISDISGEVIPCLANCDTNP